MFTRKFFGKEFQSKDELIIEALVLATTTATRTAAHQNVYIVDGIHLPTNIIDYKSIFQKIIQNFRYKRSSGKKIPT
jgi:hypothetical protein